jgi:hypothetical protein
MRRGYKGKSGWSEICVTEMRRGYKGKSWWSDICVTELRRGNEGEWERWEICVTEMGRGNKIVCKLVNMWQPRNASEIFYSINYNYRVTNTQNRYVFNNSHLHGHYFWQIRHYFHVKYSASKLMNICFDVSMSAYLTYFKHHFNSTNINTKLVNIFKHPMSILKKNYKNMLHNFAIGCWN